MPAKATPKPRPTLPAKPRNASTRQPAVRPPEPVDPELEAPVEEIIGRVADKWTMFVLETLEEHGVVRFTWLGTLIGGISQKMLTQTLRQMECDGLVRRTVHPLIPPRVECELTPLGQSLDEAFCGVWKWAAKHHDEIRRARATFHAARP